MIEKKTVKVMVRIMQVGEDDAMNTTDATKTAKVVAVGPTNEYGKTYRILNRFCNNI
jgi:hypothetical protein